jgi:putative tryptophan/tyrosine transport system substrate-binding protein
LPADETFVEAFRESGRMLPRVVVPAIADLPEFTAAGGLVSYSGNQPESYRIAGTYAGRVLKREKPENLPVQQATKIEISINLETAEMLGLTIPPQLLVAADDLIE